MGITLFETKVVKYFMNVMPHSLYFFQDKIVILFFKKKDRNILFGFYAIKRLKYENNFVVSFLALTSSYEPKCCQ
jgi:hypothetical protein